MILPLAIRTRVSYVRTALDIQGEQEFSTEINASVSDCLAAITDFETYPQWCSPIRASTVLERYADQRARIVEFRLDMVLKVVRYVLEYEYPAVDRLTWHSVEGDVESIAGSYVFEKTGAKRTRATCRQAISLGFWVPGPIRAMMERQALKQTVLEFKDEVERRGAKHKSSRAATKPAKRRPRG